MNRTALASIWPPTAAAASQAGHERMSPVQAIRRNTRGSLQEGVSEQGGSAGGLVPASRASSGIGLQEADDEQGEETGGYTMDEVY